MLFSKYLFNKEDMSESDYKYARIGFIADSSLYSGALSFLLGAYLTGLLTLIGSTEAQTNLILSLATPIAFLQIVVPALFGDFPHKKSIIFFCRFFEVPLLAICFLLPLTSTPPQTAILLIGILVLLKHTLGWLYNPYYNDILMNCLSKHGGIGKFSGTQTTVNSIVTCIAMFFAGQITKLYIGDTAKYGYMWLGIIAIILWMAQITFLFFIKEPYTPQLKSKSNTNLKKIFKDMFIAPSIRTFLLFDTLYITGTTLSNTLTNVMCVQRLGIGLDIISYLAIAEFILRIILMPVFGRVTDKFGARKLIIVGIFFVAIVYILHGLMNTSNMISLKIISTVSMCIGVSLISVSSLSYTFESLPTTNRSSYLACCSVFKNFVCSIASLSVTLFISVAQGMNIQILNFSLNELNTMLFLGAVITLISAIPLIKNRKND